MIPTSLKDWSLNSVKELIVRGAFEDESFDLKEILPHIRNEADKKRLQKSCAAFANANGGYLAFGIKDDKGLDVEERLVGLDPTLDFPQHFGSHARNCNPSINWEFLNPPIKLDSGNVIHVVWIPKSWRAPHGVSGREGEFIFPKRTNQGNEAMSMEEIRSGFLGFYEKRLKLQLLQSELQTILQNAAQLQITDPQKMRTTYSLVSFDASVLNSILADTYTITAEYTNFHRAITNMRQQIRIANNRIELLFSIVNMPMTNIESKIAQHNTEMQSTALSILQNCQIAQQELSRILSV